MGSVAVAAGFAVAFGSPAADAERPVALASMAPGSCFRYPSATYVQRHHEPSDKVIREGEPVSCTQRHHGEVVAQAAIDSDRLRYNDPIAGSRAACADPFADYNPDFWRLPANIEIVSLPPTEQGLTDRPVATCAYLSLQTPLVASLRADPSHLTADQRRYLGAVRAYDGVSAEGLETRESAPNGELIAWAKEMATAELHMLDDLQQIGAPAGAEKQYAVVLDQHRKSVAAWQAAAAETDPKEIHRQMTAARDAEHASMDADQAVRAVLGLSITMRPRGYSL